MLSSNTSQVVQYLEEYEPHFKTLKMSMDAANKRILALQAKLGDKLKTLKRGEMFPDIKFRDSLTGEDLKLAEEYEGELGIYQLADLEYERMRSEFLAEVRAIQAAVNSISGVSEKLVATLRSVNDVIGKFLNREKEAVDKDYVDAGNPSMTEDEYSNTMAASTQANHRSPIAKHGLQKTAGSHIASLATIARLEKYRDLQEEAGLALSQSEINELDRAKSEAAFYKMTSSTNFHTAQYEKPDKYIENSKDKKDTRIKLMYVHKDNIPESLQGDVVFYDNGDYKKAVDYRPGQPADAAIQDIKVVVVEPNEKGVYQPKRVNGILLYVSIPTTNVTRTVRTQTGADFEQYMYGEQDLLSIIETARDSKGKTIYRGELKPAAKDAINAHLELRSGILQSPEPLMKDIIGQSFAMVNSGDYVKRRFSKTLGSNLKSQELHVITENKVEISGKTYSGQPGRVMVNVNGVGVPMWANKVSDKTIDNISNLVTLNARNIARRDRQELDADQSKRVDPNDPNSKAIQSVIKEMVYFGDITKTLTDKTRRFYIENGNVFFGEFGKIEKHQLANPSEDGGGAKIAEFKLWLKENIHYNPDASLIKKDKEYTTKINQRGTFDTRKSSFEAGLIKKGIKKNSTLYKSSLETWEENHQDLKKSAKIDPNTYIHYKVSKDGVATKTTWENYTEYLLGDGIKESRREVEEIPLYSYLPPKVSQSLDKSYLTAQVKNKYLLLDKEKDASKLESYSAFTKKNSTPKKTTKTGSEGGGSTANPGATSLTAALQTVKNILSTKIFAFKASVVKAATSTELNDQFITRFRYKGNKVMIEDIFDVKEKSVVTDPDIIATITARALKIMEDIDLTDGINKIVEANSKDQFENDFMVFDPTPKSTPAGVKPKGPKLGGTPLTPNSQDGKVCPPKA